jgi:hypothetical protein
VKRPWWRRWWAIAAYVLIVLVIGVRIALPYVLRRVIESQGEAFLAGKVRVANVDLWLLQGAVAIEGVELIGDRPGALPLASTDVSPGASPGVAPAASGTEAPAESASPAPAASVDAQGTPASLADGKTAAPPADGGAPAPRVAFRRLYVDLRWRPLFSRVVELEEVTLDGPEVDVERLRDGGVVVPVLRPPAPGAEPAPPPAEPPAEDAAPWNVVVDTARLRDGKLVLLDRVPEPPQNVTISLDGIELKGFRLRAEDENQAPGVGTIEARFGDGTVKLETDLANRGDGFAVTATATLDNLPLDRLQMHAPEIGWSDFRGRLDGKLQVHLEPNALPLASGTVVLRDVQVDVPGESEPALAWRRFEVDVERVDLAQRSVAVNRVALDGAGVLVRPLDLPPLPLLPRTAEGKPAPPVDATVAPAAAPSTPKTAEPERAFRWSVGKVELSDCMAKVFLAPPPLELRIPSLTVEGLSSERGSRAQVALEVRERDGSVKVAGALGIDPLAADVTVGLDAIAVENLAAAAGVVPPVLKHASLGADLKVALGEGPVRVSGRVSLAEFDVAPPEGEDYGFAWKRFEIDVRDLQVPNVPPAAGAQSPAGTQSPGAAAAAPIKIDLARVALTSPRIRLTRTADGLVLPAPQVTLGKADAAAPGSGGSAPADGPAPTPAPAATAIAPTPAADASAPDDGTVREKAAQLAVEAKGAAQEMAATSPFTLTLGELAIDDGEITVLDRTVQPFYKGRVAALELDVHDFQYPANRFRDLRLTAKAPGGAPLVVDAKQRGETLTVSADAKGLALPQLNPYVTGAAGYSISRGTFSLESKVELDSRGYHADSALAFDDLDVAGAAGDALFTDKFGVSLSLALALLRDVSGRIALDVPLTGDRSGGVRPDLAPIVAQALSRALINALASPLKLLGALSLDDGKVAAFAPEPIGFVAGQAKIADDAWWRIEQLAGVLAASPALQVELTGETSAADARALREAAVLADLQQEQGFFAGLKDLPSRGTRKAIRAVLEARAQGEASEALDADDEAKLEEWVGAKTIGDEQMRALASERAGRLREVLIKDYGFGDDRIVVRDPSPTPGSAAQVGVQLGARG